MMGSKKNDAGATRGVALAHWRPEHPVFLLDHCIDATSRLVVLGLWQGIARTILFTCFTHMSVLAASFHRIFFFAGRFHGQHVRTKLQVSENVVTGTVQRTSADVMSAYSEADIRCIHASCADSGFGSIRRHRGWPAA